MRVERSGVTRLVLLVGPYAVKVPRWHNRRFWAGPLRGWLANRSEWKQRRRDGVNRPLLTLGHVAAVYRRAVAVGASDPERAPSFARRVVVDEDGERLDCEESKGSSWGWFEDRWLLIDYDKAYEPPRGVVGGVYYGRQERMARRWMREAA